MRSVTDVFTEALNAWFSTWSVVSQAAAAAPAALLSLPLPSSLRGLVLASRSQSGHPFRKKKSKKKSYYEFSVAGCEPLLLASCGALGPCQASGLPLQGRASAAAVGFEPLTHCQG